VRRDADVLVDQLCGFVGGEAGLGRGSQSQRGPECGDEREGFEAAREDGRPSIDDKRNGSANGGGRKDCPTFKLRFFVWRGFTETVWSTGIAGLHFLKSLKRKTGKMD
jgi:hypothetical protein